MKKYILFLVSLGMLGCSRDSANYLADDLPAEGMILTSWRMIGPFKAEADKNGLDIDFLKESGSSEESIRFNDLEDIRPKDTAGFANKQVDTLNGLHFDFNKIFKLKEDSSVRGAMYAGCTIESSEKRMLKLNFSADDGVKVWLNNKLIFTRELSSDIHPYVNYIDLPLQEGENFLLIKVSNIDRKWGMFAAIEKESKESLVRHQRNFELLYGNYYLSKNIVENDTIKLTWGMPDGAYRLEIDGQRDTTFDLKINQNIDISNLPNEGFYTTKLYTRGDTFSSRFYKTKDVNKTFTQLIKTLSAAEDHINSDTFKGLLHRYQLLMKPENLPQQGYQKRDWDKKMLFILENLFVQNDILKGKPEGKSASGCLLRSYRSEIDNGPQYYILHVPDSYKQGQPMPLVIEMSKLMKWFPSPLETNRFANISLIEHFDDLANKFNMIVVEPGNRTVDKPNYNNIDEADLWENIGDIKRSYTIDTTRVFLRGACRSSYDALKLAVKYPDRFAAIGTVSPELVLSSGEKEIWQHQNNPLNFLENIKNHPFYNVHSKLDTHSPILASERLSEMAKNSGLRNYSYRKLALEFKPYYSEEYLEDIFQFFKNVPAGKQPKQVHYSTDQLKYNKAYWLTINSIQTGKTAKMDIRVDNNTFNVSRANVLKYTLDLSKVPFDRKAPLTLIDNGRKLFSGKVKSDRLVVRANALVNGRRYKNSEVEGPFAHIFTKPFLVVPGTGGDKVDTAKINEVVRKLNDDWKKRYYSDFRSKPDREVIQQDIVSSNLLLVGSPQSNLLINKLLSKLTFRVGDNSLVIGRRKFNGKSLGYYFIYPNPYNSKKYIAVIGFNSPNLFNVISDNVFSETRKRIPLGDISNFGWYDYRVWEGDSEKVISGYFDYRWE